MFQIIGGVVSLVALLAALWGGYKWGSHDLDIVKAQLEEVRNTAKLVKESDEAFRKRLDQQLATQATEHEAKMADLKKRDEQDMAALTLAKSKAEQSAAAYRAKANAATGQVADLQKKIDLAPTAEEKARLQKQLDDAVAARDNALQLASAESCLRLPVPPEFVKSLNLSALP